MTLFLHALEKAGVAEAEALVARLDQVVGKAQVQGPEAADDGASEGDVGGPGRGD